MQKNIFKNIFTDKHLIDTRKDSVKNSGTPAIDYNQLKNEKKVWPVKTLHHRSNKCIKMIAH